MTSLVKRMTIDVVGVDQWSTAATPGEYVGQVVSLKTLTTCQKIPHFLLNSTLKDPETNSNCLCERLLLCEESVSLATRTEFGGSAITTFP